MAANLSRAVAGLYAGGGWEAAAIDLASGLFILRTWRSAETQEVPEHRLALCAAIAALSPLSHFHYFRETHQVTLLALVLVSLPFFLGSSRHFVPVLLCCLGGWVLAASAAPASAAAWGSGILLLAAMASLWHRITIRRRERLREKRRIDEINRLKAGEQKRLAVEAASDGYWYWDVRANRVQLSASWAEMVGCRAEELGDDPEDWFSRVHPHHRPILTDALNAHIFGKTARFQAQYKIRHRDGHYVSVLNRGLALRDSADRVYAMAGSQVDVTHLVESERAQVEESFRDRLTGLANREAFLVRVGRALDHMKRHEGGQFALMFLDLDQFKLVNDSLGHLVGDQLLASVAARLRECVRENRGDLVGRFGGDEFVVLLEETASAEEAMVVADRIVESTSLPFVIGKNEIRTGVSIGIALCDRLVENSASILRNADTAMYRAKAAGRGQVVLFSTDMHAQTARINELRTALATAAEKHELEIHYQPIVSAASEEIVGSEALVRWRRQGELISPVEFIPIAEESGLIVPVGEWILRSACKQAAAWTRSGLSDIKVSVNISPRQLQEPDLANMVVSVLEECQLDPSQLELEVTETALMKHVEVVAGTIAALDRLGVGFALDDFGTGYSSIEHLRRFTFRTLKIDRSFVAGLPADSKSAALAGGLIDLAHQMGLTVTAEGVETPQQLAFLKSLGCDRIQGFLLGRPLKPADLTKLLQPENSVASLFRSPLVARAGA